MVKRMLMRLFGIFILATGMLGILVGTDVSFPLLVRTLLGVNGGAATAAGFLIIARF